MIFVHGDIQEVCVNHVIYIIRENKVHFHNLNNINVGIVN
jgi:hypothetical protein